MEPEERLFLNLIGDFTVEDIKYAIASDLDMSKLMQEEIPDFLAAAREAAKVYVRKHPDRKELLKKPDDAAKKLVQVLKVYKPVLGYEIELYKVHPSTTSVGFKIKGSAQVPVPQERVAATRAEHVGYAWVSKNLVNISELLLR